MFVSETNIFDHGDIKIKVSSMDGLTVLLGVNPDITIDHLKIQVSSHLYDPVESVKTSLYHRLLHVNSGCLLDEENTLSLCGVKDHDELLLIKKRITGLGLEGAHSRTREDSKKTPTPEDIKGATRELPLVNPGTKHADDIQPVGFKEELRKILVTLIDAAQKILCFNPEATKIFEDTEKCVAGMSKTNIDHLHVDDDAFKQLTAMGFPDNQVRKALILNCMSTVDAIQWLIEHEEDPDIDTPVQCKLTPCNVNMSNSEKKGPSHAMQALELAQKSGPQKVKKMLNGFRAYRRKEFRANVKALKTLTEMGFGEADVLDALSIHGNKQEEACEWLLNGGHLKQLDENLREALTADSPVYNAIMTSPVVQIGLNNPKSLLAFLMILENPNSTQQWLNDAEIGPMLIQLSRIYHAEKHTNI